ncbi:MAG: hypothetical protein JO055_12125 [Alphaproteobacteria bacterium]|nr:hypothetical protein [Alphaproteobacteria bacterium]
MFALFFERQHHVLLVRFSDRLARDDLARLDRDARAFVAEYGVSRGIVDFTAVEVVEIETAEFVRRGQQAAIMTGQDRVYVMPRPDLFGLGRMFSTYQKIGGNREPLIVRTLDEAYGALELVDPQFEPLPLAPRASNGQAQA